LSVNSSEMIPVLKPLLPSVEQLTRYLQRIDNTRLYSNHGPLWSEFRAGLESWLSARIGGERVFVIPISNGTTAIEVALRLRALPGRRFCLMPSYTFIASAHAVCNVGLEPFLLDIDAKTLTLTPEIAEEALSMLPEPPAAVLVISAFGAPPDIGGWKVFEERHGIPVVFDAAAALASLDCVGDQPLAVSLHATKVFGIGEGGAVVTTDSAVAEKVVATIGFGFARAERVSYLRGGNYRISEYTAAAGLAVLETIDAKILALKCIGQSYARALEGRATRLQTGAGTEWATMTLNAIVPSDRLEETIARLDADAIQWRRWWGLGTHRHPAFSDLRQGDLSVTDRVAPCVIGVPIFEEIAPQQIARVVDALS
jgi:dTDP-4-amino-4,6-dideoxygalactose transaminase